jgi:predicted methyltransferase
MSHRYALRSRARYAAAALRAVLAGCTTVCMAVCMIGFVAISAAGCGEDEGVYTFREPTPPEGTGKVYMDREIARPSGHMEDLAWFDRPSRAATELPGRVVQALGLTPAQEVADIGAGTGYFTRLLAQEVPRGTVYAVDIERALLDTVTTRAQREGFANVEAVLGTPTSPNLAPASVDVALVVDTYHEFSHPHEMANGLFEALRPGGQLVVVEYRGEDPTLPVEPLHSMTEAQIRRELEATGFTWVETRSILPQQHLVVFERPLADG